MIPALPEPALYDAAEDEEGFTRAQLEQYARDYMAAILEAVAWMTHHDEPMIFRTREEAILYCYFDEDPIALYAIKEEE